jgi:hypothetical protein
MYVPTNGNDLSPFYLTERERGGRERLNYKHSVK